MDSTSYAPSYQDVMALPESQEEPLSNHDNYPRLCPDIYDAKNYTFCRWAKCVSGWDVNSEKHVLVAVTCKRWGCPYCATRKVRRLAWMCRNAEPNRLLTVTVSSHRYTDPKSAWDGMSKAFPELIRYIRKDWGPCEYLRVLELTAIGTPHFHCLLRGPFVLHRDILAEWRRLINEPPLDQPMPPEITLDHTTWRAPDGTIKKWAGVNIKPIDKSFATFRYLVKYLTKLHKIPWTDRHVSYSRDFFRPEDKELCEYAKLDNIQKYEDHPWTWLI